MMYTVLRHAGMAELADAPDLGSGVLRRAGSIPVTRTSWSVVTVFEKVAASQMLNTQKFTAF